MATFRSRWTPALIVSLSASGLSCASGPTTEPPPASPAVEQRPADESREAEAPSLGLARDFPDYYQDLIRVIAECWTEPHDTPKGSAATVFFRVQRDGSISESRLAERSGHDGFDQSALGAIRDCAGDGRLDPLPEDFPDDSLPIRFEFRPRRAGVS